MNLQRKFQEKGGLSRNVSLTTEKCENSTHLRLTGKMDYPITIDMA